MSLDYSLYFRYLGKDLICASFEGGRFLFSPTCLILLQQYSFIILCRMVRVLLRFWQMEKIRYIRALDMMTRVQNSENSLVFMCLISQDPSSAFSGVTLKHSTYIFILSCLFEGQMLRLGMDDRTELGLTSHSQFPLC